MGTANANKSTMTIPSAASPPSHLTTVPPMRGWGGADIRTHRLDWGAKVSTGHLDHHPRAAV